MSTLAPAHPLLTLLELMRRVRLASSVAEQRFILLNDTHALVTYRQAALWVQVTGIEALSGVVQVEANAPYTQWLSKVCTHLAQHTAQAQAVHATDLPPELAQEWDEWLPPYALWLPVPLTAGNEDRLGGLIMAREIAFEHSEISLLSQWCEAWAHAWSALLRRKPSLCYWRHLFTWSSPSNELKGPNKPVKSALWGRPLVIFSTLLLVALFPVRMTVLSPGELVPANPEVIRSPLEGVIGSFQVQPNQRVKQGQLLFVFDEALIRSKLDVARQALATAESEYRQAAQMALTDSKSKSALSMLTGKIAERRAETEYIAEQLVRTQVFAPRDGVVLFDDPSEWMGKPVAVGERIMRVASTDDIEVEVWVGLADAIPLPENAKVSMYLNTSPLAPVQAQVRYLAHDAVQRPDGTYAYRLRARLIEPTDHKVGLKGTARLEGDDVPLIYWVLRRPLASIRAMIGF